MPEQLQKTYFPHLEEAPPEKVISSIFRAFPGQAYEIFAELKYSHMNGCYFFERWGMYVGVEEDGYIHS